MKALFTFFLGLVVVFAFCAELRIEVQGDSTAHYQYQIDDAQTVFELIDSCGVPYSLEYYSEFGTDYLRTFAQTTASGISGWQYFKNWVIGSTGISQTIVSDTCEVLIVYGVDFNNQQGIRPLKITSSENCINQGEDFILNIFAITPAGDTPVSGNVNLRLLLDENTYQDIILQANTGQINLQIPQSGMYEFFVDSIPGNNQYIRSNTLFVIVQQGTESVDNLQNPAVIVQNYPNPFNKLTTIRYSLKSDETVRVDIYNVRGQLVRTLIDNSQKSGEYRLFWDTKNNNGEDVSAGMYFYKIQTGKYSATKKMILMK